MTWKLLCFNLVSSLFMESMILGATAQNENEEIFRRAAMQQQYENFEKHTSLQTQGLPHPPPELIKITNFSVAISLGDRVKQEDTFATWSGKLNEKDVKIAAVFDGHTSIEGLIGHPLSRLASELIIEKIILVLNGVKSNNPCQLSISLNEAFKLLTRELLEKLGPQHFTGSTAVVTVVYGDDIYFMNLGDSRAVLLYKNRENRKWLAKQTTVDHKPYEQGEYLRLYNARQWNLLTNIGLTNRIPKNNHPMNTKPAYLDGTCTSFLYSESINKTWWRSSRIEDRKISFLDGLEGVRTGLYRWGTAVDCPRYMGLAVTGGLGDASHKELRREPEISYILGYKTRYSDSMVLMGSDGLFDFVKNQAFADYLGSEFTTPEMKEKVAFDFVVGALNAAETGHADNTTAIVIFGG